MGPLPESVATRRRCSGGRTNTDSDKGVGALWPVRIPAGWFSNRPVGCSHRAESSGKKYRHVFPPAPPGMFFRNPDMKKFVRSPAPSLVSCGGDVWAWSVAYSAWACARVPGVSWVPKRSVCPSFVSRFLDGQFSFSYWFFGLPGVELGCKLLLLALVVGACVFG